MRRHHNDRAIFGIEKMLKSLEFDQSLHLFLRARPERAVIDRRARETHVDAARKLDPLIF